jgi:type I restriction enzyme, S subunit
MEAATAKGSSCERSAPSMTKSKRIETPPPASETEVPEGWISVQAGAVCEINPRKPNANVLPAHELVTFLPMAAVDDHSGTIAAPEFRTFGELRPKSYTPFAEGDVLLAKITPSMENGKAALARGLRNKLGFGSTEFHVFRSSGAILPEYLYHYIRQQAFRDDAQAHMTGSAGQLRVPVEYVRALQLPLAPLAEQKRIVAKVEELLGRVNAGRARLAKVPAILERFRQAVVGAAGSGRLTADWRSQGGEPNRVLEQVAAARARRVDTLSARKKRRDDGRPSVLHARELSESGLPDIPDDWCWARCADLIQPERALTYGVIKLGAPVEDGVPTLRSSDVRWLHIEQDRIKRVSPSIASKFSRTFLQGGEVLVTVRGTLGGVAVAPAHMKGYNVSREVAVVPVEPILDPAFVALAIAAEWSQNWLAGVAKGVAYTGVNIEDLRRLPIPLPPVAEQREIVLRAEGLFALANKVEAHVRAATVRAERMPQAILTRAFRGELVTTEAQLAAEEGREYESASALLERIKELRNQQKPATGGRGGKKMTKRSGRQTANYRRPLAEVLREQRKPLTPERLFDLAGFDEETVDEFYEQLRGLIQAGTVRERRPNGKDVTLEAVEA